MMKKVIGIMAVSVILSGVVSFWKCMKLAKSRD